MGKKNKFLLTRKFINHLAKVNIRIISVSFALPLSVGAFKTIETAKTVAEMASGIMNNESKQKILDGAVKIASSKLALLVTISITRFTFIYITSIISLKLYIACGILIAKIIS
jgi:hypothetical protein